jgi:hypothetical protein
MMSPSVMASLCDGLGPGFRVGGDLMIIIISDRPGQSMIAICNQRVQVFIYFKACFYSIHRRLC